MIIYQCDECGGREDPVITLYPKGGRADFCSMECMRDWATDTAVTGYLAELGLLGT